MGFGAILQNLITPATQAVGAYDAGQQKGQQQQVQNLLTMLELKRQQANDAATIGHLNAQTQKLGEETFGAPFKATYQGKPAMMERGSRGTVRPIEGVEPFEPEKETFTLSHDYTVNGEHVPVQVGNRGSVRSVDGTPLDPKQIRAFEAPQKGIKTWQGPNKEILNLEAGAMPPQGYVPYSATGNGGGGSQSLTPEDRARMINQARLDNKKMKELEIQVMDELKRTGRNPIGVPEGIAGGLSEAHGQGVSSKVLAPIGNMATGVLNKKYQEYLVAQRSFGRLMGNLQSKRYSDNQSEIERSISGLGANDLPNTIAYRQQLRDLAVQDLDRLDSGTGQKASGGRGGGGGGVSHPLMDKYGLMPKSP